MLVSRRAFLSLAAASGVTALAACESSARGPISARDTGARADGVTDDTAAIQRAIDRASRQGGNIVRVPKGHYRVATLHLRRSVQLFLGKGAVLTGAPFVVAERISGARVSGPGTIERGGIECTDCVNVAISDVTIAQAPERAITLTRCDNVEVAHVDITYAQQDGVVVDSCRTVKVRDGYVAAARDGVVVRASSPGVAKTIAITGQTVLAPGAALRVDATGPGSIDGVTFGACRVYYGGMTIDAAGGGHVRTVTFDGIHMTEVPQPFAITLGAGGAIGNVAINNVSAREAEHTSVVAGRAGAPIVDVRLLNVAIGADVAPVLAASHVDGLSLQAVDLTARAGDPLAVDAVTNLVRR